MIQDIITFKGKRILTILHRGLDSEIHHRQLHKCEKIGRFNLIFEESVIDDNVNINSNFQQAFFLELNDELNPYKGHACANAIHHFFLDKPDCLFKQSDSFTLLVDAETYNKICSFIEQFTGMSLLKTPVYFGDVFVFTSQLIQEKLHDDQNLIISGLPTDPTIDIDFKLNGGIIKHQKFDSNSVENSSVTISPGCNWGSYDLYVLSGEQLYYAVKNRSFVKKIHISGEVIERQKQLIFSRTQRSILVKERSKAFESTIGDNQETVLESMMSVNSHLLDEIQLDGHDPNFLFVERGNTDAAYSYILKFVERSEQEIWVFDSYFADRNNFPGSLDCIRIFASYPITKHIVFQRGPIEKRLSLTELNDRLRGDTNLQSLNRQSGHYNFYQIETNIHDRFIFSYSSKDIKGIQIGTSLNSMSSNYFTMRALADGDAALIFKTLQKLVNEDTNKKVSRF